MKICILYGGRSEEREVSIKTGESVYNSIYNNYDIRKYDFNGDYELIYKAVCYVDLVFISLHGCECDDGTVQKYLESKNIKFTGSYSKASEIAMNKHQTKKLCLKNNIPTLFQQKRTIPNIKRFMKGYIFIS